MIAVRRSGNPADPAEQYYPKKLTFPVTAFLRIVPAQAGQPGRGGRCCVLELYDPLDSSTTLVANRLVPLETDLSTPLGYKLDEGQENQALTIATLGLLNPDSADFIQGLYMVEPYDPHKIPVVMVHGLWSSPMTWMEMFNDLLAYPEIRSNYQFWFYLYPTGQPFWRSADQMRSDLAKARQTLDPDGTNPMFDQMVLVGHSMGGLVSMMQTLESGNDFWSVMSDHPFEELQADPAVRDEICPDGVFRTERGRARSDHHRDAAPRQHVRERIHAVPGPQTDTTTVAHAVGHAAVDPRESRLLPGYRPADDFHQHRLTGARFPHLSGYALGETSALGELSQYRRRDSRGFVLETLLGPRRRRGGLRQRPPRGFSIRNCRGRGSHDRPRASPRDSGGAPHPARTSVPGTRDRSRTRVVNHQRPLPDDPGGG